jgi:hypothetical protein
VNDGGSTDEHQREEECGSDMSHSLSPILSTANAVALDWFPTMLFLRYVHVLFLLSIAASRVDFRALTA